jgi:leucyl-tRNA synthetase
MSKSKNNGVDPQAIIDAYGADTARLFMMFAAPPDQQLEWSDAGVEGAFRFLRRVWSFAHDYHTELTSTIQPIDPSYVFDSEADFKKARREIHVVLKQANFDFQRLQFNTVVSASMKLLNILGVDIEGLGSHMELHKTIGRNQQETSRRQEIMQEGYRILLRLLSPITPHIAQTLWKELGYGHDILAAPWPEVDEAALVQDEIELMIQVNGKLRGSLRVSKDANKATIEQLALAHEAVLKQLDGGTAKKIIVVPGRLVNVVA